MTSFDLINKRVPDFDLRHAIALLEIDRNAFGHARSTVGTLGKMDKSASGSEDGYALVVMSFLAPIPRALARASRRPSKLQHSTD
jgi:hypothetical protein